MSGVRVGTRLEQLEALRRQVDQEIAVERRRLATEAQHRPPTRTAPRRSKSNLTGGVGKGSSSVLIRVRLEQLGVTSKQVKQWAVDRGLLDRIHRGTVRVELIDAYERTHTDRAAPCAT